MKAFGSSGLLALSGCLRPGRGESKDRIAAGRDVSAGKQILKRRSSKPVGRSGLRDTLSPLVEGVE